MQDKVILITGGNAGIGKFTAKGLAELGATIVIACRRKWHGEKTVFLLRKVTHNPNIFYIPCDLADLHSVTQCATIFKSQFPKLDVLINNAGVFTNKLQQTKHGFEMHFGVNHLGHFFLTKLLIDHLGEAPAPRIINVSSVAHRHGKIDFDSFMGGDPDCFNGFHAYAQSKLANILFTKQLAHRFKDITSFSLHPGLVRTSIGNKNTTWHLSMLWHFWKMFMISPKKGAKTSIYLASAPDIEHLSGAYFNDIQELEEMSETGANLMLARRLWDKSEVLIQRAISSHNGNASIRQ